MNAAPMHALAQGLTSHAARLAPDATDPVRVAVLHDGASKLGLKSDGQWLFEAVERAGGSPEHVNLAQLRLGPGDSLVHADGTAFHMPDAAIMYHGAMAPEGTGAMLDAMEGAGVAVLNPRGPWELMTDKWETYRRWEAAGIPVPASRLVQSVDDARRALRELGNPELVLKLPRGTEGKEVFKVANDADIQREAAPLFERGESLMASELVHSPDPVNGRQSDVRIMLVRGADGDYQEISSFRKTAPEGGWVTNIAAGGAGQRSQIPSVDMENAKRAARVLDADIVGLDAIGPDGAMRFLEGNSGPGMPWAAEGFNVGAIAQPIGDAAVELGRRARITASGT